MARVSTTSPPARLPFPGTEQINPAEVFSGPGYQAPRTRTDPAAVAADRRSQVGSGDRSERIRTYNFPQGRVTDHRIGLTLYKIDAVLDGELDEILAGLITADQAERLKQVN